MEEKSITKSYELAQERYAEIGVDTEEALKKLADIPISMHCWQGDDVGGFENNGELSNGGIMATGSYPGKANTPEELRMDIEKALSLIPGKHRLNLHAIYAETGGKKVERNELDFFHFETWTSWAKEKGLGLDFNPTFFTHPKAESGFTLSNRDEGVRKFWVEHGIACREIAERMGKELENPCVCNVWIPDGYKDIPYDRKTPRTLLEKSLDEMFRSEKKNCLDAVESKLFGIGSESYVVGSHEFYMGYAVRNNKILTLDTGHFHPTESIADKLSAVLLSLDEVLLHVSRPVRWDSDHVVILSDEVKGLAREIIRGDFLDHVHIGLDFFDASINRIAAWVIGMRAMQKALLIALLEPGDILKKRESEGDLTYRLALQEELSAMPFSSVWDRFCLANGVPVGIGWMDKVKVYEKNVLNRRK